MNFKLTIVFIFIYSLCFAQDHWYVHATSGNDANDGTSWVQAELTIAGVRSNVSGADTIHMRGSFSETLSGGGSAIGSVWIDSLVYLDGSWRNFSLRDTTILNWGTTVQQISMINSDDLMVVGIQGSSLSTGNARSGQKVYYCRIKTTGTASIFVALEASADTIRYCLFEFDHNASTVPWQFLNNADDWFIEHCTIISQSTGSDLIEIRDPISAGTATSFRNNIVYWNLEAANQIINNAGSGEVFHDIDCNIYFSTGPEEFNWEGNIINFNSWVDSIQTDLDPDGESNSQFADPALILGSNFGLISNGSIAVRAACDGTEIGFWQFGKRFNVRRRGIKR